MVCWLIQIVPPVAVIIGKGLIVTCAVTVFVHPLVLVPVIVYKRVSFIINYLINKGCDAKAIKYSGRNDKKNEETQLKGGRRIEYEVTNPK